MYLSLFFSILSEHAFFQRHALLMSDGDVTLPEGSVAARWPTVSEVPLCGMKAKQEMLISNCEARIREQVKMRTVHRLNREMH